MLSPVDFELEISKIAIKLLEEIFDPNILYRSTGVFLERIGEQGAEQLCLYTDEIQNQKQEKLAKCFDNLEKRFGKNIVKTGFSHKNLNEIKKSEEQ